MLIPSSHTLFFHGISERCVVLNYSSMITENTPRDELFGSGFCTCNVLTHPFLVNGSHWNPALTGRFQHRLSTILSTRNPSRKLSLTSWLHRLLFVFLHNTTKRRQIACRVELPCRDRVVRARKRSAFASLALFFSFGNNHNF